MQPDAPYRRISHCGSRAPHPTPGTPAIAGGRPGIIRNGAVEGACGVGGGTAQQDEDCARAGIAQL